MSEPVAATAVAPPTPRAASVAGGLEDPLAGAQLPADGAAGAAGAPAGAELAVYLLEQLQAGVADPLSELGGEVRPAAAKVMGTIQKHRAMVDACIKDGVDRSTGAGVERVRPAPAHVIAGFLGLAPPDPAYVRPQ